MKNNIKLVLAVMYLILCICAVLLANAIDLSFEAKTVIFILSSGGIITTYLFINNLTK